MPNVLPEWKCESRNIVEFKLTQSNRSILTWGNSSRGPINTDIIQKA